MPVQRKKTKTKAQKKPASKKSTPKRRTRGGKKKSALKKNVFIVLGVFFVIAMVAFGYFLGNNNTSSRDKVIHSQTSQKDKGNVYHVKEDAKKNLTNLPKIKKTDPKVIKEEKPVIKSTESKKVERKPLKENPPKSVEKEKQKQAKKKVVLISGAGKPRLAIIIDDVSSAEQIKSIQSTGLRLTPSIFPPFELSMKSHKLAIPLEHYMIHLPMESGNKKFNTQLKTLKTSFSQAQIDARVKEIRKLFPRARYVNNHTGSVFTDNYQAMYRLYSALRKEGFVFVDSRTISSTKVSKVAKTFGDAYVSRDVFIDNQHNIPYIHAQLEKAVKIAKKRGYAVAIGHPHHITMQALSSAQHILKDIEIVYIDNLYKK